MYLYVGANISNGPLPLALPEKILTKAYLCSSLAFFVMNS
jgi:hypothetical protein